MQECAEAGQKTPYEQELVLSPEELDTRAYSIVQRHFLVYKKTVVERDTDLLTREELYLQGRSCSSNSR